MSLFKKLFGSGNQPATANSSTSVEKDSSQNSPSVVFGRYTDCNKNTKQLQHWNDSILAFKNQSYVDSFEHLLNYVRDEQVNNLTLKRTGDQVDFEFIQGSQRVKGEANRNQFRAEAYIVEMPIPSIPVMRKVMNLNYGLNYSKFGLKGTTLCMKFSSNAIDASPNKLYAGLCELAKKADQQDDLLLSEFSSLRELEASHLPPLPTKNKAIKYAYLLELIRTTRSEVDRYDREKMAGGISFLLLDLTYKIDYLICPQGIITNELEKIQLIFFENSQATTMDRNARIIAAYDQLVQLSEEKLMEGLYDVKATFGIAKATAHKTVMDMMFKEREKVAWYRDNGYSTIVDSIYSYMVSYSFFNYGMVFPVTDLLNIVMHVFNPQYYERMGDTNRYVTSNGQLDAKSIINSINAIVKNAQSTGYPYVNMNTAALRFDSRLTFVDALIVELDKIDLRKN